MQIVPAGSGGGSPAARAALLWLLLLALASPAAGQLPGSGNRSEAALAATVHQLRGCLGLLSAGNLRLLQLRFGVGGRPRQTEAALGKRLGLSPAAVTRKELRAVRRLVAARRRGACQADPKAKSTGGTPAPGQPGSGGGGRHPGPGAGGSRARGRAAAGPAPSGGWTQPEVLVALGVALICLLGLIRETVRAVR